MYIDELYTWIFYNFINQYQWNKFNKQEGGKKERQYKYFLDIFVSKSIQVWIDHMLKSSQWYSNKIMSKSLKSLLFVTLPFTRPKYSEDKLSAVGAPLWLMARG